MSFAGALARTAQDEWRQANTLKFAPVAEVDAEKAMVRLRMGGSDEEPFLSPWVPYTQVAGALKVHTPPSVGQQFALISSAGDWELGVALPLTWSDQNESPSEAADENVATFGSVRAELTASGLKITVGDTVVDITAGGIALEGADLTHNDIFIGDTHEHTLVEPGGGLSGPPPGD